MPQYKSKTKRKAKPVGCACPFAKSKKPAPKTAPVGRGAFAIVENDATVATADSLDKALVLACKRIRGTTHIAHVLDRKNKKKHSVAYIKKGNGGYYIAMHGDSANRINPNTGKPTGDVL